MKQRSFYVQVSNEEPVDFWESEIRFDVTDEEDAILSGLEPGRGEFFNCEELGDLYRRVENAVNEREIQRFFDKHPEAEDNGFDDYQIIIDI